MPKFKYFLRISFFSYSSASRLPHDSCVSFICIAIQFPDIIITWNKLQMEFRNLGIVDTDRKNIEMENNDGILWVFHMRTSRLFSLYDTIAI